jgi:hypothetical protein
LYALARTQAGQLHDLRDGRTVGDHRGQRPAALAPDRLGEGVVEHLVLGEFKVAAQRIRLPQVVSTVELEERLHLGRLGLVTGR